MSITHTISKNISDGVDTVNSPNVVSSGAELVLDETIPAPSTNLAVAFAFANNKLKSIVLLSDIALAIYTNDVSGGSPQETIHLVANKPYVWVLADSYIGSSNASPFAGNVTGFYVTLGGSTAARLRVWAILDPT